MWLSAGYRVELGMLLFAWHRLYMDMWLSVRYWVELSV